MLSKKQSVVKLDFDVAKEPDMEPIWQLLRRAGYTAVDVLVKRSPSKRGWHMLLVLDPRPRTAMEVVAIQAVLGSDPQREAMQLARARAFPNVNEEYLQERFAKAWEANPGKLFKAQTAQPVALPGQPGAQAPSALQNRPSVKDAVGPSGSLYGQ